MLDHVEASLSGGKLVMRNPFDYAVKVRILADDPATWQQDLGLFPEKKYRIVELDPCETKTVEL